MESCIDGVYLGFVIVGQIYGMRIAIRVDMLWDSRSLAAMAQSSNLIGQITNVLFLENGLKIPWNSLLSYQLERISRLRVLAIQSNVRHELLTKANAKYKKI